jgi:imidazolonepropionase
MSSFHIINIKSLAGIRTNQDWAAGKSMAELNCLQDAFIVVEDGIIAGYGTMGELDQKGFKKSREKVFDVMGRTMLPCWCDSHTHIVFAGSRENEFVAKIHGKSYAEINAAGGGILNSAKKLQEMPEERLFQEAWSRVESVCQMGTGALEIKSGYGLTVEAELKMLRVIKKIRERSPLTIRASFLGAHTYPLEYRENHQGYIDLITEQMLPVIAREKLADFIDVFCEEGFFSPQETETLCLAGKRLGLIPKLHVNQLHSIGGIRTGIHMGALSMDHLEKMTETDIMDLKHAQREGRSSPMATLLPSAAFFLDMPFQPARKMINAGCAIALATDFNPGSSPSGNMNFVISLSCIRMKMLPEEAINAATINGAFAMGCQDELGSIGVGKKANFILTKPIPSLACLPYFFGNPSIENVMIKGDWIQDFTISAQ